ncbi:hypothetical protein [Xanthobacter agilis]|jgi:hypothetical protein|uniref:DUF2569 domain-containing protein n=1 Tax=Xanthobacter agilis TaxID=47492 RepID=A0ABU0LCK6_XANAG|nr:hypothetical protein [Xanthobacter agilis]MDQ0504854.1 hypothetical protein [Xanthobacter agilis]
MTETRSAVPVSPQPKPRRRPQERETPKLGGALMVLFWCACGITALPLAGLFSLIASTGVSGATWALGETFGGATIQAQLLRLGLWPQLVLFAWGASFVVLTVMKSRHALTVSPWLLAAWVAVSAYSQFSIRAAMAPDGATMADFAALAPGLLAQALGTAALFGYFKEGTRPRAYYTKGP